MALLLVNGVSAMSEMAVVAARKARLEHGADAGARAALDLAVHPTNLTIFLSPVQVGITVVRILARAFGGAGIASRPAVLPGEIALLARFADAATLGLVMARRWRHSHRGAR